MVAVSATLGLLAVLAAPVPPATGAEVIRAMHARYNKTWYRQLTFVQRAIWTDGRPEEEWWEALRLPGRLRIDVAPVDSSPQTIIYRGDSLYVFQKGKLARTVRQPNLLLVLGFDVYVEPPEETIRLLEGEGFDLDPVREDTWAGRPAYVVGGERGGRIWIDRDRLVFLRLVRNTPNGKSDIRFTKYEKLGGGWIGTEVEFYSDGKETFREIYRDWRIDRAVAEDLFDVTEWKRPRWVSPQ